MNEQTRHLINAERLSLMKPSAILINTSRGGVIDEAALVEALRSKRIAAAGLDVYEKEPSLAQGLAELENTFLLPHLGSATVEDRTWMMEIAVKQHRRRAQRKEAAACVRRVIPENEPRRTRRSRRKELNDVPISAISAYSAVDCPHRRSGQVFGQLRFAHLREQVLMRANFIQAENDRRNDHRHHKVNHAIRQQHAQCRRGIDLIGQHVHDDRLKHARPPGTWLPTPITCAIMNNPTKPAKLIDVIGGSSAHSTPATRAMSSEPMINCASDNRTEGTGNRQDLIRMSSRCQALHTK
jgi:hypothetical protein